MGGVILKTLFILILSIYVSLAVAAQESVNSDSLPSLAQTENEQIESEKINDSPVRPDETQIILNLENDSGNTNSESSSENTAQLPGIGFGDILRFVFIFAIFIVVIYLFLLFLRRISGVKAGGKNIIRLVSAQPLKGESALYIVEVASRFFLISSSGHSVNLIAEFDDDDSRNQIIMNDRPDDDSDNSGGFTQILARKFSQWRIRKVRNLVMRNKESSELNGNPADYLRGQRERLRKL